MSRLFISIYHYLNRRKFIVFGLIVFLFVLFIWFGTKIKLEEDITGFMPETPQTERTNFVLRNLSTNDKIVVKLSVTDTTRTDVQDYLIECADSLVDSLKANPGSDYIKDIFYRIDDSMITGTYDFILQNLPLYLKDDDYKRLDSLLNGNGIEPVLAQNKRDLLSPIGFIYKKYLIADPLHISNRIFKDLRTSSIDSMYNTYNGYIFSKDNKNLLIFITSAHGIGETGKNVVLADALEEKIHGLKERSGETLSVTCFGAAIVGVSNAKQIKKDSYISTAISLILIILLLGSFFRSMRSLMLLLVPVLFGTGFSLALLYFIKGTLSAIALGAGSAILGIAINYTLHFLVHYKHSGSIENTIKDLVSPLVIGSITTIGAFLSLLFVSSGALRDFGLFAALSLSGTILFVLILMPHFLRGPSASSSHYPLFFDRISEFRLDNNKWVIIGIVVLTLIFGFYARRLTFESDMNKISFMTPEQKKAFNELSNFTNISQKSIIHVSEGKNVNEALFNYESAKTTIDSLVRTRNISSVSGIGTMLMSDSLQAKKIEQWNNFWPDKIKPLQDSFEYSGLQLGFRKNSFDSFFKSLHKKYTSKSYNELLEGAAFSSGYIINKPGRCFIITLLYVDSKNEAAVKHALGSQKGTFVFDRVSATKATINVLSNDFNFVLVVCALLVLVFLTFSFGSLELSLLTFIPMVVGWLWILGLMAIFDLKFNIVNIILATFIFGLGDDYSIFIMEGSMREYSTKQKILNSYKLGVILSVLTMFIGIGSLIFAKHPAMKSLAQVTIIGMFSVVVISYTILPFTYRWLTTKKGVKRIMPITFRNMINSAYSFLAFLIGSLFHSVIGFLMFRVTKPTDRKKLFFHKCLAFTARFVVFRIPGVKTHVVNETGEDFMKPAVIICNHQSHIDLMLIMMLSPRIVILTNEWVWNSPFYGNIVKYADFYPVVNGVESSIEHLSDLIKKGYSIMIFPEGTRSADCSINRFHKGAFYLAEQLKLDILPVIIHGMGHVLPKTDFLLRRGKVRVEILSRIKPEEKSYGEFYSLRGKNIRKMYKDVYQRIATENETPDYYADALIHNYIYKGVSVSTRVRIDMKRNKNFRALIKLIPDSGRVLVLGAGTGAFPLLLSMVKKSLVIDTVESDEDNMAIAVNCASNSDRISYINSAPTDFAIGQKYDVIVLTGFLATLEMAEQQLIMRKCISNSPLVLYSGIRYTWFDKILLKFSGNHLQKSDKFDPSYLNQLSKDLLCSLSRADDIFTISRINEKI